MNEKEISGFSEDLRVALKAKPYLKHDINYGDNVKVIKLPHDSKWMIFLLKMTFFHTFMNSKQENQKIFQSKISSQWLKLVSKKKVFFAQIE